MNAQGQAERHVTRGLCPVCAWALGRALETAG